MTHAIRFARTGGPEVLEYLETEVGRPGPGEVRLRQFAVGLNFIDIYHRSGLYPLPLPSGIGLEGAGVVEALGSAVTGLAVGDRVAYAGGPPGAYAGCRLLPADQLVPLPPEISFERAAALMLKGLTAQYLLHRTHRLQPGEWVLVHAAAGGVGQLLCQWARALGARVIGAVGSEAKAELARERGCQHVIVYRQENVPGQVRALTGGRGVDVVYDSVGRDSFEDSLRCLRPLGLMVSYGNASGPVPPVDIGLLARMGSLFLTRPTLMSYTARRSDLLAMAESLFQALRDGHLTPASPRVRPMAEAADAQRELESGSTTGATVLVP